MASVTPIGTTLEPVGQRVASAKHPIYTLFEAEWRKLADVREATGGFMTGEYLVAHPREWEDHTATTPIKPTKKLKARRQLARYENLAAAILEATKESLFRIAPTRRAGSPDMVSPIEEWWQNVDGLGTSITEAMPHWWDLAATFGHVVLYFEQPSGQAQTAADQDQPYIRVYTPLDVINWLTDDNGDLVSLKFTEVVPATDYAELPAASRTRIRIVDAEMWTVTDDHGVRVDSGEHGLGRLPVAFLYGKPRSLLRHVGQSVLGTAGPYIDLYNLTSEARELIRNQTFSMINIPLGTGTDAINIETAQAMLGQQSGSMNVLYSGLAAQMLTGDSANVEIIQKEIQQLKRDIYRVAGVPWEADSRDAESGDSLRLRRDELNTRLAGYADRCEQAERDLVDLYYRWRETPERADEVLDRDQATVQYPERFDPTPFEALLDQIQAARDIQMPAVFMKTLRKALVAKFDGMASLEPETLNAIMEAIDAAEDEPSPAQQARDRLELQRLALSGRQQGDEDDAADTDEDDAPD